MKVQQIFEGEWTEWVKGDRLQCCDCLMIHEVEFRIVKGCLELRFTTDNRSTAAYRRENGIKVTKDGGNGHH